MHANSSRRFLYTGTAYSILHRYRDFDNIPDENHDIDIMMINSLPSSIQPRKAPEPEYHDFG